MKTRTYEGGSLLHGPERSARLFFLSCLFSISLHGVFVAVFVFLSNYTPYQNRFSQSVIKVNMVTLPSEAEPLGEAQPPTPEPVPEPAEPPSEVPLVTAEESEVQVVREEPEPPPEPEPMETEAPEPEPTPIPRDRVVIEDAPEQTVPPERVDRETVPPEPPVRTKRPQTRKPEKTVAKVVEPEEVRTESIKDAISRVREKVAKEIARKGSQQPRVARPQPAKPAPSGRTGSVGRGPSGGEPGAISDIYRAQLTYQIEKNWAFPEHLADTRGDLVTVIVVNILPSGHVKDVWFKDRSGNSYLDDSAYRAVMKSNPLPPLPQGYNAYTVALVFTPSGLN
jgi:colicin import membrane protein